MKTLLLFGTFDGLHDGHRACFTQAKKLAEHLVVAVAPDDVVVELKGRTPHAKLDERVQALKAEPLVDEVVVGDRDLGTYEILRTVQPAIVGIGYDQHALAESLRAWARTHLPHLEIVRLEPHHPDQFKSSKLIHPDV